MRAVCLIPKALGFPAAVFSFGSLKPFASEAWEFPGAKRTEMCLAAHWKFFEQDEHQEFEHLDPEHYVDIA